MKLNERSNHPTTIRPGSNFGNACMASCQKVLTQINRAKAAIFAEARHALRAPEGLLRLAVNEAEAVAWQTAYPHLIFPALAAEKIQAVAAWNRTQQSMHRRRPASALAA